MEILVVNAKSLPDLDGFGKGDTDAYCTIEIDGMPKQKTKTIDNNLNPQWDHKATYDMAGKTPPMIAVFTVSDEDTISDEVAGIGELNITPELLLEAATESQKMTIKLKDQKGSANGALLQIQLSSKKAIEPKPTATATGAGGSSEVVKPVFKLPANFTCPDTLVVTICNCIDLIDADGFGKGDSDPYVEISLNGGTATKTAVVDGSLRPQWNHQEKYKLKSKMDHTLSLTVWDSDVTGSDYLGSAIFKITPEIIHTAATTGTAVTLDKYLTGNEQNTDFAQKHGGANKQGKIFISIGTMSAIAPASGTEKTASQKADEKIKLDKLKASGTIPDILNIMILSAKGLADMDTIGTSDPYCVVTATGGIAEQQTPVIDGTLSPTWNHKMSFDIPVSTSGFTPIDFSFSVNDSDVRGFDLLGTAKLRLTELLLYTVFADKKQYSLPLVQPEGATTETGAELYLSLSSMRSGGGQQEDKTPIVGPCPDMMEICVERAVDLIDRDSFGESDPFVIVSVEGHEDQQTPVIDGQLSPEWNHKLLYQLKGKDNNPITFRVEDSDPVGSEFLGFCEAVVTPQMIRRSVKKPQKLALKLKPRPGNESDSTWLSKLKSKEIGRLFVSVTAVPKAPSTKSGKPKWIYITMKNATGLADRDLIGGSDPYVYLEIEGQKSQQTPESSGSEPEWNHEIKTEVCKGEVVSLTVYDSDTTGMGDFLGHASIQVTDAILASDSKHTLQLKPRLGNKSDAKFAKKQNDNLGRLFVSIAVSTGDKPVVAVKKPVPKPVVREMPKPVPKPTPKPIPKKVIKAPIEPPPVVKKPIAVPLDPIPVRQPEPEPEYEPEYEPEPQPIQNPPAGLPLHAEESEALKELLVISPVIRSKAALLVGDEWKMWSWRQRLVVAQQIAGETRNVERRDREMAQGQAHMTAPLRTHYVGRNTDYSISGGRDFLPNYQNHQQGNHSSVISDQRPTRMQDLFRDRKRQAMQDLEDERSFRQKNEVRQYEHQYNNYPTATRSQPQQSPNINVHAGAPLLRDNYYSEMSGVGGTVRPQSSSYQTNSNIGLLSNNYRAGTQSPSRDRWWNHSAEYQQQQHNHHPGQRR